jgi:hypothetical protein
MIEGSSPCRGWEFFSSPRRPSRPALGPNQRLVQWVPGALSLGVKRPGRKANYSPPSNAEVKNAWSYTWRGAQLKKQRAKFTFTS